MAGQKKILVRDILLGISDREVGAAMKEFGKVKKVQTKVTGKWQPSKLSIEDAKKAAQIEAALKKCNFEILDKINKEKFAEKFDKQIDNLFETNKNMADSEETTEDMKNSESGLSSRVPSPSPG
ncbi:hypothetical protein G9A89_009497 [Geosiphon pyriformis]|nr:hypothetical protein G9A89_009497 [Geosiphon pyriformis]